MDWLATKQATKRALNAARYESHLRLHVLPAFGPVPVAAITRHDVQAWINALARGNLGASTIGDIYRGVFKAVLPANAAAGPSPASPPDHPEPQDQPTSYQASTSTAITSRQRQHAREPPPHTRKAIKPTRTAHDTAPATISTDRTPNVRGKRENGPN